TNIWLYSLPTLTITLFLASFSLGLLYNRKRRQVGILKTRGISSYQMFIILLGEAVIVTILSIGLGTIAGLPFAYLILQSKGFLDFTGGMIPLNLSLAVFPLVFAFGLIFAFLLNFHTTTRLARLNISESVVPQDKKAPFWKRKYLDVIIFGTGLVGVSAVIFLKNLFIESGGYGPNDPFIFIAMLILLAVRLFGIPAPLFITVGGAMLIARLLPVFLRAAAHWTWKVEGGMIAFSFRNVLQRLAHASRATLLVTIVIAFSIAFITIPYNNDANTIDNYYYHTSGADMLITPANSTIYNQTFVNYLQNNLPGIVSVSPVAQAYAELSSNQWLHVYGVDINTFAQTAFFREDFLNQDLLSSISRFDIESTISAFRRGDLYPDTPDLATLLSKLHSNRTVLLQEDNLRAANLNVNDQLSLVLTVYNETSEAIENTRYDFDVVGTFKCWPRLVTYALSPYYTSAIYMVTIPEIIYTKICSTTDGGDFKTKLNFIELGVTHPTLVFNP
ncbi:MAG: ABC transporter permease, partial [Candidatus Hodarchaeota archaeon]